MSAIHFMPWCPLEKEYAVGEVSLMPFDQTARNEQFDQAELSRVLSILSSYRDLKGRPNRLLTLVKYKDRPVFSEMSSEEFQVARELVELACFSAISKRAYLSFGEYSNASNFIFYGQQFTLDSQDSDYAAITIRRRDGQTSDLRSFSNTVFSIPVQASRIDPVALDEKFLASLIGFRETGESKGWSRWQNAVECFNLANTDADNITYQVEWTLLCAAFERLLEADSKAIDVASKFSDILRPTNPLAVGAAKRKSDRWRDLTKPLSLEWMREFYSVRGDFAHGKLRTEQPLTWHAQEHLVLATIAFPLCVKRLLEQALIYAPTRNDQLEIDAFECLADSPFLTEPPNSRGSMDSWWARCLHKARSEQTVRRAVAFWEENIKKQE